MQLPSETLLQGGKYRIIEKIGQGGFGVTYKAEDTALERMVAIKEFFFAANCERQTGTNQVTFSANNSELVTKLKHKFLNEAKRLAKFTHNSIVSIYDVFEENGTAYFSMEYIKSGSLDDLVRKSGELSESKALTYIQQLGEVLHYLHSRQTCHLDIKPANVLLDENGRIKLIDFGLSKQYEINTAHTTTLLAVSKGYAPIEQYSQGGISDFSPTADIYSLGATLYFLLKGEAPPEAIQLVVSKLPEIKNVSDATNTAIQYAMKANSKERPQSVTEWLAKFDKPGMEPPQSAKKKKPALTSAEIKQPIEETEILQPIAFVYDNIGGFREGLASVEQNGKWGCINKSGNIVIPIVYDQVGGFYEGLAYIKLNGKYGFIDKSGKHVIPVVYDHPSTFSEGLARVELNGKYVFIDKTGKQVIPSGFIWAGYFQEGLAMVVQKKYSLFNSVRLWPLDGSKYGFIDKSGKHVIPYNYDHASGFSEGLACVKLNGKYGFIDKSGQEIIAFRNDNTSDFSEGLAGVEHNAKCGFIDKTGQQMIPFIYEEASDFSEGLARVKLNGKYGFIDKRGQPVIPLIYEGAYSFSEGLARVELNRKYGFIDKRGQQVIPFIYDDSKIFSEGLAWVKQNEKWGFIDKMGKGI